jgi:Family of unknown function (DUF6416)
MIDVTVKVPEDRVPEFYQMYGTWLNGRAQVSPTLGSDTTAEDAHDRQHWSGEDGDLAAEVWRKLTEPAKRLFSTLIDNPGTRFSGDKLAKMVDMPNGKHGVAGLLGWPRNHCDAVKRDLFWSSDMPDGELKEYWRTPENAALFRRARDSQS